MNMIVNNSQTLRKLFENPPSNKHDNESKY